MISVPLQEETAPGSDCLCIGWEPAPGLVLRLVRVPVFLRRYLPRIRFEDGLARPPVSLDAFERPLDFLDPGERARVRGFSSLKKQVEWICGRLAAKSAARAAGVPLAPGRILVDYRRQGAPFFPALPHLSVTISHSHAWAGAVVGQGAQMGLDMEQVPAARPDFLLMAGFSRRERTELAEASPAAVIRCWTLKEAFLKFIGKGFNESLAAVEVLRGQVHHHNRPVEGIGVIQSRLEKNIWMTLVAGRRKAKAMPGSPLMGSRCKAKTSQVTKVNYSDLK